MNYTLNEVFIEDDLEEIEKFKGSGVIYSFPVITVGKQVVFFNNASVKAGLIKEAVQWFITKEYVIGLPAKKEDKNAFKILTKNGSYSTTTFPYQLRKEKNIQCGYYKLYKFKDGFAFKRNELIKEDTNG